MNRVLTKVPNWLKTAVVMLGILAILSLLCIAISAYATLVMIQSTEPYARSVELALDSPEVQQALGAPITVGHFPQGNVNDVNGGDAELYIPLHGTSASASIRVNGTRIDGTWKYYAIRVDTNSGLRINLLEP
ncbi:MAG: cytochrome c oxidase assembly factor Coa1 family protein [Chloroflexota bacterium]